MIAEHFPGPIIYNKEKRNPFSKWNRQNWKAEKLLSYRSAETYWELCFIIRFSDESFLVQAPVLSCWINSRKLFSYKLIRWLETKLCSCIWRWWSSNYFQQRISVSCSQNHWRHQTAQSHHQSSKYKFPGNSLKHNKNTTVVPVNARFVAITIFFFFLKTVVGIITAYRWLLLWWDQERCNIVSKHLCWFGFPLLGFFASRLPFDKFR